MQTKEKDCSGLSLSNFESWKHCRQTFHITSNYTEGSHFLSVPQISNLYKNRGTVLIFPCNIEVLRNRRKLVNLRKDCQRSRSDADRIQEVKRIMPSRLATGRMQKGEK